MVIEGIQAVPTLLHHITPWPDAWGGVHHLFSSDGLVLAQLKTETDIFAQVGSAWDNFVKTGQIWALLIGIVIGYMFRSFTSF
jgi:hypothetical protein